MPWRKIGGTEVELHSFLTSALDWDEWSTSGADCFNPLLREAASGTHTKEAGSPQEPAWTFRRTEKSLTGIRTPDRLARSRITITKDDTQ